MTRTVRPGERISVRHAVPPPPGKAWKQLPYAVAPETVELGPVVVPPPPPPVDPPPPTTRPFPAPTTVRTVTVTGDPVAFLADKAKCPDGSVVLFGPAYTLPKGLALLGRRDLILRGQGTKLTLTGNGQDPFASAFVLRDSHNIAIDGTWDIAGPTQPLTNSIGEGAHVLCLSGWGATPPSSYVEMTGVNASNMWGDGVYLEGRNAAPGEPSHHVWTHHNRYASLGRNGISWINVTDALHEDESFDRISYHAFDIEPNFPNAQFPWVEQVKRITVRRMKVGSYGHRTGLLGFFIADVPLGTSAPVEDITFDDIDVAGNPAAGYGGKPLGLQSKFISKGGVRHKRISLTNLRCPRPIDASYGSGGALYFKDIDGVTVKDIAQPLTGVLTRFDNCTGVVTA